ncbi:MAG TPA: DNA polymerase III subunit beta [Thermoanaerobaculia bacterium]|nr:DNA polymerase III subunit beta [Thermoanaerobaculia bacterium]
MELTLRRGDFLNELTLMQGVVERKNTIPILSNILLKASDGHLDFTSTDLDLTLLSRAAAKVSRPGSVTVPARKLFDLIRNLPEAEVALKLLDNHYLGVTCERSNFRLVAQPAEDFPTVPRVEGKGHLAFPLDLWKRLTRKVLYAVSAEETRFQLMGALLKDMGKEFELVATDGHRLAIVDFPKGDSKGTLPDVLIPKKALAEILKMDGSEGEKLEVRHSENHLLFTVGSRQLIARLLDVNFPPYEKILSKENDRVAIASRTACQGAVRRVALFSSERSRGVKLSFEDNTLTVASASQELGEGTETLDVQFDGEPVSIGLNAQYLLDFLDEVETENVRLELKDENTQCVCKPEGGVEWASRYVYVVMPMRL